MIVDVGWCRVILYVGVGVGGVEGEWESGGSGSIGVGGWRDEGLMSGIECIEINCFLGDDVLMVL